MPIADKPHFLGTLLLFTSSILLLITSISAPIWAQVGLLQATTSYQTINFGTFGFCVLNQGGYNPAGCSPISIGYNPTWLMSSVSGVAISTLMAGTSPGLTTAMILHPIAAGFAFIAFLIAAGRGKLPASVKPIVGSISALLAWLLTLVSVTVDFSLFGTVLRHVNQYGSVSHAEYGSAIWCLVAAFAMLTVAILCIERRYFSTFFSKAGGVGGG